MEYKMRGKYEMKRNQTKQKTKVKKANKNYPKGSKEKEQIIMMYLKLLQTIHALYTYAYYASDLFPKAAKNGSIP